MQQMPRPFPGAKGAKRYAGLLLEQMQEPGWRQIDRCRAIGRRHLAPGEIVEAQGGAPDARIDVAVRQFLAKNQPVEFGGGKAATPLLTAQGLIGGHEFVARCRAIPSRKHLAAQGNQRRGLDRFRLNHQADDRGMFAFDAVGHIGRNDRDLADHLRLALGDLEAALHRGIDAETTAGSFSRPAQQAGIKHPLGADQHQPPGFAAIIVIHGPSLPGTISRFLAGSLTEPCQNTAIAPDVTDANIGEYWRFRTIWRDRVAAAFRSAARPSARRRRGLRRQPPA